jgi:hypothetical protein
MDLAWSDVHGAVAVSEQARVVLQLDENEEWREIGPFVGEPGEYADNLWVGLNGEICSGNLSRRPDVVFQGWDGSAWEEYTEGTVCGLSIVGRNDVGMGVSNSYLFEMEYFPYATYTVFQPGNGVLEELIFPPLWSTRTRVMDIEASGTGVIYFLTSDSLYRALDLGKTWELLTGKGTHAGQSV